MSRWSLDVKVVRKLEENPKKARFKTWGRGPASRGRIAAARLALVIVQAPRRRITDAAQHGEHHGTDI